MVMPDSAPLDPYESTDTVVCPSCVSVNGEHQHFCRECGTPLTSLSVIDPVGHIYATGDTYRKAMNHPTNLIVVIGTWLIFTPAVLGALLPIFDGLPYTGRSERFEVRTAIGMLLYIALVVGMGVVAVVILYRVTLNYVRLRAQPNDDAADDDSEDLSNTP